MQGHSFVVETRRMIANKALKDLNRNTVIPLKLNLYNPLFYVFGLCEIILLPFCLFC